VSRTPPRRGGRGRSPDHESSRSRSRTPPRRRR
jgi:hypothetical protein